VQVPEINTGNENSAAIQLTYIAVCKSISCVKYPYSLVWFY